MKLAEHYKSGKPIFWKRVHKVPDFAYFNHSVHVNKGIQCESCHSEIKQMEKVGQMNSFTMRHCLSCHRNAHERLPDVEGIKNGPTNCFACHR